MRTTEPTIYGYGPNNETRSAAAYDALEYHAEQTNGEGPDGDGLTASLNNLLVDLMHLCGEGMVRQQVDAAAAHYHAEAASRTTESKS